MLFDRAPHYQSVERELQQHLLRARSRASVSSREWPRTVSLPNSSGRWFAHNQQNSDLSPPLTSTAPALLLARLYCSCIHHPLPPNHLLPPAGRRVNNYSTAATIRGQRHQRPPLPPALTRGAPACLVAEKFLGLPGARASSDLLGGAHQFPRCYQSTVLQGISPQYSVSEASI